MNETLATSSNLAVYAAMVLLALAMLAYTVDLAALRSRVSAGTITPAAPGDDALPAVTGQQSRRWALAGTVGSLAALVALVAAIALRGLSVHRPPLGNMYEFALVGAAFALLLYLAWGLRADLRWLGLFVTGPVLLTLMLAVLVWWTEPAALMPALRGVWLVIHVTIATLSIAVFTLGFSLTVLYLVQAHREEARRSGAPLRATFMEALPGSAALDRAAYATHIVAFPLWTFTIIAGAIWAEAAWSRYWGWDPKEVWSFVIWAVYAAYLHARATVGVREQGAAWIAVAGFACIIINYVVVNQFFVGMHSYSGM